MPCNIKNPANIDLSQLKSHINGMYDHFDQKLGFKKPPTMIFNSDPDNQSNVLGKTAYYDPNSLEIHIYSDGRHPKDMLRSIAHELIHHHQNLEGRLNVGGYHGEGYYLENKELKKLEHEAMLKGNALMREYEDTRKRKERNEMSLNEWKNNELNRLLMKKFGILKEEKEITHMCALKVTHKQSGQVGHPIRHTLSESGGISHYTVEFDKVIVENIAVENLDIVEEAEHSHKRDDEKKHDDKKPVVSEEELSEENRTAAQKSEDDKYAAEKEKEKVYEPTGDDYLDPAPKTLTLEEQEEGAKPDFPDVDGDGDKKEPISKAQQDKKDAESGGNEEDDEGDDSSDKDLSKVPPQLRDHVKGKANEGLQEQIRKVLKNNKKLRLRLK